MLGPVSVRPSNATLAPVVLIRGTEGVLADRARGALLAQAREIDPAVELSTVQAAAYEVGTLTYLASPSLFGERRAVVVEGAEAMNDAFLKDALAYLEAPADDVWLIVLHGGGTRGKRLLDAIAKTFPVVACEPIKRDSDKVDFVRGDVRDAGRRIDTEAVHALIEAVGSDLRELDSAVRQLLADTTGAITTEMVNRYYGGRVEATGFRVADAAAQGKAAEALTLARHALATGTNPVPVVAALAAKLRTLAKVGAARGRGMSARDLGLAPWQVQRAERDLHGWTPESLAHAILAVARADEDVKGASRDPEFALERAIYSIVRARRGGEA